MRRYGIISLTGLQAACAAGETRAEGARLASDLPEAGKTSAGGANASFSRSVAARYAHGATAA